uniref:Uncharacterized protein n=1 Tax=Lactuca sativa TaxID=4236 RepID=A0A9R1W318_LACSA|nr:hypothetical protein LSAT_V11C300104950 [Lactuca sativa]
MLAYVFKLQNKRERQNVISSGDTHVRPQLRSSDVSADGAVILQLSALKLLIFCHISMLKWQERRHYPRHKGSPFLNLSISLPA